MQFLVSMRLCLVGVRSHFSTFTKLLAAQVGYKYGNHGPGSHTNRWLNKNDNYKFRPRSSDSHFGSIRHGAYTGGFSRTQRSEFGPRLQSVDWSEQDLPSIIHVPYAEHPSVAERPQTEIAAWLKKHDVTLSGKDIPRPIFTFEEANFPSQILDVLSAFSAPTLIQSISWPIARSGRDIISIAQTGSGKTLAFMLPAIVHASRQPPRKNGDGPVVLVLTPTRELTQQVSEVSKEFLAPFGLKLASLFGGVSRTPQQEVTRRGVDIIIATPGRLLDLLHTKHVNLKRCSYLVLDEADRMLDMGFEPQIRQIIGQTRPDRQTLMFSATWPKTVRKLAAEFQKNFAFLNVGSLDLSANRNISQHVDVIKDHEKDTKLREILTDIFKKRNNKTLIFVQTKKRADQLVSMLRHRNVKAVAIHGDKTQAMRESILSRFKEGSINILIATDVAARGLDVQDISFVINYDYPNTAGDYIHRIGRTGRAGKTGTAYAFITPTEAQKAYDLIAVLNESKQTVPDALIKLDRQT